MTAASHQLAWWNQDLGVPVPGQLLGGLHPLNQANIDYNEMKEDQSPDSTRPPG